MFQRVSASFAAQLVSLAVSFADRFLLVGVLLRAWGTDVYGDWLTLVAASGLITFGELGLNVYFGNGWQRAFAQGNEAQFQRIIRVSLFSYLVLGSLLGGLGLLFALSTDLDGVLALTAIGTRDATIVFLLLVAANVLRVLRGSISQIYRGRGANAEGILVSTLPTASALVLACAAAKLGAGAGGVALCYVAADLALGCGAMLYDLRRRYPSLAFRPAQPTRPEVRQILDNAPWFGLLQGAPVLWLQVPVLVIGALGISGAPLVSFVVARTYVNFARQIANTFAMSAGVEVANAFHVGDRSAIARMMSLFGSVLCGAGGVVAGGLAAFSVPIITLWTGSADVAMPSVVLWLLASSFLVVPALPLSAVLSYGNLPRPVALASLVQLGLGLALCAALGRSFGISGVAAGLALGEALAFGVLLPAVSARHVGLDYVPYLARGAVVFALSAIWGWTSGTFLLERFDAGSFWGLLATLSLWAVLATAPVLAAGLPASQRARFAGALAAGPRAWLSGARRG